METLSKTDQAGLLAFSSFDGQTLVSTGGLDEVAVSTKQHFDTTHLSSILVFDNSTGDVVDIDFRGSMDEVLSRLSWNSGQESATTKLIESLKQEQSGPGRPKLGVVAREVTLLPRHWEWLNKQSGGASIAIRKLVEEARKLSVDKDKARESQDRTYRFMHAIAGDLRGYEEALRVLYATDKDKFATIMLNWPKDVRNHTLALAEDSFKAI